MHVRQFEAFYWIAKLGSFRAAAAQLRTTQPAISARVRELERHLGVALFDRAHRTARLTASGRSLLAFAERMVALAQEIQEHVAGRQGLSGRVRLGTNSAIAATWLPKLLRRIARRHPGLEVEFVVDFSLTIRRMLLGGDLDVAFVAGPVPGKHVVTEVLGRVSVDWLASPDLALPNRPARPRDLAVWPIVSDTRGTHLHDMAMVWFRSDGVEPRLHHSCAHPSTRIQLAALGLGIGLVPAASAVIELQQGRLRRVITTPPLPELDYVSAYVPTGVIPAVPAIVELAREVFAEEPAFRLDAIPRLARG